jgi:hypothetical protein
MFGLIPIAYPAPPSYPAPYIDDTRANPYPMRKLRKYQGPADWEVRKARKARRRMVNESRRMNRK